jgi:hypothetical protein
MAMNYNGSPDEICRIVANGLEQEYKKIIQEHLQNFLNEAKKEMEINLNQLLKTATEGLVSKVNHYYKTQEDRIELAVYFNNTEIK